MEKERLDLEKSVRLQSWFKKCNCHIACFSLLQLKPAYKNLEFSRSGLTGPYCNYQGNVS